MWNTFIVQPIFNLLVAILALLPGHDYGVAILIFTLLTRVLLWPIIRKQLHHSKRIKALQPQIKEIKTKAKGNKTLENTNMMNFYKKEEINPLAPIGYLIIQMPVIIGIFQVVRKLANNPEAIARETYSPVRDLAYTQDVIGNPELLDQSLLGVIDLTKQGIQDGQIYIPLVILALLAGFIQYIQAKQIMPTSDKPKRKLRDIMAESAKTGDEPDKEEMQAAVGRSTMLIFPVLLIVIGLIYPGGLALYMTASAFIGYMQHRFVLNQDLEEMQEVAVTSRKVSASKKAKKVESKVVSTRKTNTSNTAKKSNSKTKKKAKK